MSDGANIGNFPFVEFDNKGVHYHSTESFKLKEKNGKITVEIQELKHEQ